ncbi:hypothetical protein SKAU_G00110410 [Synaphobranchus kaupii]|uniref:Family with sequence similarity 131 member C n=1 Tax=Synaphobranchus kaupii TaxID=118154 RepID=A0A9Q1J8E3_SYNKA|nr:hypothetical protein SKAU_G00110410 [Synaphobranchus kaupii]
MHGDLLGTPSIFVSSFTSSRCQIRQDLRFKNPRAPIRHLLQTCSVLMKDSPLSRVPRSHLMGHYQGSRVLVGLVATIKEHITKPTAMAQGRVAHLIEWKGWSSGAGAEGAGYTWGGAGAGRQVDEQLYCHLTDEIKEARFAAGVAAQFALAEAAMYAWSSQDAPVEPNCNIAPLQAPA